MRSPWLFVHIFFRFTRVNVRSFRRCCTLQLIYPSTNDSAVDNWNILSPFSSIQRPDWLERVLSSKLTDSALFLDTTEVRSIDNRQCRRSAAKLSTPLIFYSCYPAFSVTLVAGKNLLCPLSAAVIVTCQKRNWLLTLWKNSYRYVLMASFFVAPRECVWMNVTKDTVLLSTRLQM